MKNLLKVKFVQIAICLITGTIAKPQTFYSYDLNPGSGASAPYNLTVVDDLLFFAAYDSSIYGYSRLYISDGTTAGTHLISNVSPSNKPFIGYNNKCYFQAYDPATGTELWASDGTVPNTVLIKDIYQGTNSGMSFSLFTENNGLLYFIAKDDMLTPGLFKSNGSTGGTQLVKHLSAYEFLVSYNNKIYFSGNDDSTYQNPGLWVSDGSYGGTNLLNEIDPGHAPNIDWFKVYNNKLYFAANDNINKSQLWVTDGSSGGTMMVVDITQGNPGIYGSMPSYLTVFNNKLYFRANNSTDGSQVWVTEGDALSTHVLKVINSPSGCQPSSFTMLNNLMYFVANDGIHGFEVWVTDGTEVGTQLVKDISPGSYTGSNPHHLTVYHNKLYFVANDGNTGDQLWVSDGTVNGTHVLQPPNMYIGQFLTNCNGMTVYNDRLYYNAAYNNIGDELWAFDDALASINNYNEANNNINIYPNPTQNNLTIEVTNIGNSKDGNIKIFSSLGLLILQKSLTENISVIDVSSLAKGIYFIEISNDDFFEVKRVVKE